MAAELAELDDPRRRAQLLVAQARWSFLHSEYAAQGDFASEAAAVAREAGLLDVETNAVLWRGKGLTWAYEHDEARSTLEHALALARQAGLRSVESETLRYLAIVANNQSRLAEAEQLLYQALEIRRADQDLEGEGISVRAQAERDARARWRRAMLDRERELGVVPAQVEVRVAPRMKLGAATQRLALAQAGRALAGVMDDDDGELVVTLEVPQVRQEGRDLGAGVLVDAMQPHEGIEDEERRPQGRDSRRQTLLIGGEVQPQTGRGGVGPRASGCARAGLREKRLGRRRGIEADHDGMTILVSFKQLGKLAAPEAGGPPSAPPARSRAAASTWGSNRGNPAQRAACQGSSRVGARTWSFRSNWFRPPPHE
jgi:tetratricopeptide (TPR) repeat protein